MYLQLFIVQFIHLLLKGFIETVSRKAPGPQSVFPSTQYIIFTPGLFLYVCSSLVLPPHIHDEGKSRLPTSEFLIGPNFFN